MPDNGPPFLLDYQKYIDSGIFIKNNIYFAPILHGRLEFGAVLPLLIEKIRPDVLALELPPQVKQPYLRAVSRLPFISVLCVESDGPIYYHLVEPQDGMASAVRSFGPERAENIFFVDHFCPDYRENFDDFPDPGAIFHAGYEGYCSGYYAAASSAPVCGRAHDDISRESGMAGRLNDLSARGRRVLFVCGLYHYPAIFEMLGHKNAVPFVKDTVKKAYIANLAPDSHREALSEPAFFIKHFEALRGTALPARTLPPAAGGGPAGRSGPEGEIIRFPGAVPAGRGPSGDGLDRSGSPAAREFFRAVEEIEKNWGAGFPDAVDRQGLAAKLYRTAAARYRFVTGEDVTPSAFSVLSRFMRRYTKLKSLVAPGLYEIVVGARAAVDDNFACEVFEEATDYPWIDESGALAPAVVTLRDLRIDGKTFRFHRKLKSVRRIFSPYVKKRPREKENGEWRRHWEENADSMCSHQPEDICVEDFGMFLRKKARSALTDEQSRVEPFSASLMDGIDMRETIKNYHLKKKLYVKVARRAPGRVGSVVFIFDEDVPGRALEERYPWKMTWLGEHHQESDMAFYSTRPGEKIVGPGISRCEYGGFMLSFPPLRLYDVWADPYFFTARTKPEVLLLAAIEYSTEKYVVYCAKKPPRSFFRSVAARVGKKIVYVPSGQFSPATVRKLQVVHILAGKNTRNIAREYIW